MVCVLGLMLSVQANTAQQSTVSGQVRLADGQPVAGAHVTLFDLAALHQGAVARVLTDESGYFALPLASLGGSALPQGVALGQNYPNPFNPSTVVPYQLPTAMHVRLDVFNVLGQHIATLVAEERPAGFHAAKWDATDAAGQAVAAGVYIYRLTVGGGQQTQRMVLLDGRPGWWRRLPRQRCLWPRTRRSGNMVSLFRRGLDDLHGCRFWSAHGDGSGRVGSGCGTVDERQRVGRGNFGGCE